MTSHSDLIDRLHDAVDLSRTPRELEQLCGESLAEILRLEADAARYRKLRDMSFMFTGRALDGDPLKYEKRLLDRWIAKELGRGLEA